MLTPLVLILAALANGCGAATQSNAIESTMANDHERAVAFEATARALDRHPEWVDQLYEVTKRHPRTLLRFMRDTTVDLREPRVAGANAELLVLHPRALEQTMVSTIDDARTRPEARAAIDRAMLRRSGVVVGIMTDDGALVIATLNATVAAVEQRPAARAAFLEAMRESAPRVAAILAGDPRTLRIVTAAVLKHEVHDRQDLEALLQDLGILPK